MSDLPLPSEPTSPQTSADVPPPAEALPPAAESAPATTPEAAPATEAAAETAADSSPEPAAAPADEATAPAGEASVAAPSDGVVAAAAADAGEAPAPASEAPAAPARPELSPAQCGELLKQHFPALFGGAPKPLKLRIQADIQARTPGVFTRKALGVFFHRYTGATGYLIALTKQAQRFDLDGQAAGEVSDEHRAAAQEELQRRRQITRERERANRQPPAAGAVGDGAAQPGPEGSAPAQPSQRPPRQRPARGDRPGRPGQTEGARPDRDRPPRGPRPERSPARGDGPGARSDRPDRPDRPQGGPGRPRMDRPARSDRPDRQNRPERPAREGHAGPRPMPIAEGGATGAEHLPPIALNPEAQAAADARRQRATLLREFERSPFTLANFCKLKGLKPEEVAPQIEQARREASERARPPR